MWRILWALTIYQIYWVDNKDILSMTFIFLSFLDLLDLVWLHPLMSNAVGLW